MANIANLRSCSRLRQLTAQYARPIRCISTSDKKRETITITEKVDTKEECVTETKSKNWISYGFDYKDKTADRNAMNSVMFFAITLCMVFGGFIWCYAPDFRLRDWSHREAYLELRRRESLGLPPIDRNLVDPKKIRLPSEKELKDVEIII